MSDDKPYVLILEPQGDGRRRLESMVSSQGFEVRALDEMTVDAVGALVSDKPPVALFASMPSQSDRLAALRSRYDVGAVVVTLPSKTRVPLEAARKAGADAFVVRPYELGGISAALLCAERLAAQRSHAAMIGSAKGSRLRAEDGPVASGSIAVRESVAMQSVSVGMLAGSAVGHVGVSTVESGIDPETGFYQVGLFKRLLERELFRCKRYGGELSLCLVSLDYHGLSAAEKGIAGISADMREGLAVAVAHAVASVIRKLDIAVRSGTTDYLIVLPHTSSTGAAQLGRRLQRRIHRVVYREGGVALCPRASVGIAGQSSDASLSFARLLRKAKAALRAAQLKGGDRVVVRA